MSALTLEELTCPEFLVTFRARAIRYAMKKGILNAAEDFGSFAVLSILSGVGHANLKWHFAAWVREDIGRADRGTGRLKWAETRAPVRLLDDLEDDEDEESGAYAPRTYRPAYSHFGALASDLGFSERERIVFMLVYRHAFTNQELAETFGVDVKHLAKRVRDRVRALAVRGVVG